MASYAIHYDENTGEILSYSSSLYGSSGDLFINALPPSWGTSAYRVKIVEGETPTYLIQRSTGYAYDANAYRVSEQDEAPEQGASTGGSESSTSTGGSALEGRGITIVSNGVTIRTGDDASSSSSSGSESGDGDEEDDESDDEDDPTDDIETAMTKIEDGQAVLARIELNLDDWVLSEGQWSATLMNEAITESTVLTILGLNRAALRQNLHWQSGDGQVVFTIQSGLTAARPSDNVEIYCYLMQTGDDWPAYGIIEAWPGADLVARRYRHTLHQLSDNISINGTTARTYDEYFDIPAGGTANIETPLDFAGATLLFATPEWTGHSHAVIPHFYVNSNSKFCYTITNLAANAIRVSEVAIRLMYRGTVSNLEVDDTDDGALSGYITDEDIDELVSE